MLPINSKKEKSNLPSQQTFCKKQKTKQTKKKP
jgi:hypothetical protein